MTLNSKSKYPSRRAYVLKVRGDAKPNALVGRLENLVTGQQHEFTSGHELLESISSDLQTHGSDRDPKVGDARSDGQTEIKEKGKRHE